MAYDPLLDDYEPGAKRADLALVFLALRGELVPLVAAITDAARRQLGRCAGPAASPDAAGEEILKRFYPRECQKLFGETLASAIGFDFGRGRLDVTAQPFRLGIGPGDCRITTRFDEQHY